MKKKSLISNKPKFEAPKLELEKGELFAFLSMTIKKLYSENAFSKEELQAIFYKNPVLGRLKLHKLKSCIKSGAFQEGMLNKHDLLHILEHTNACNMLHAAGEYNDLMSVFALGNNRMPSGKFLFLLYCRKGVSILNQLSSKISMDLMKCKSGDVKPVPIEEMIELCIITGDNFQKTLIDYSKEKYLEDNNWSLRKLITEIKKGNSPYKQKLKTIEEDWDWGSDVARLVDDAPQEKETLPKWNFDDSPLDEIDLCRDWNFNYDDLPNIRGNHEDMDSVLSGSTDNELDSISDYSSDHSKIGV